MEMRIAVLGATGVYGRHLVPRLIARGRSAASVAAACGAEVVAADIFDEASLRAGLVGWPARTHAIFSSHESTRS